MSRGAFGRLNLGFKGGDDPEKVRANRLIFSRALGMPLDRVVVMRQVHGIEMVRVNGSDGGRGALKRGTGIGPADGQVTTEPGLALSVSTADCIPLALFDPINRAVAALHVGWRGLLAGVVEAGVAALAGRFDSTAGELLAFMGPAIGPCCFEVGDDVADGFRRRFGPASVSGGDAAARPHVDLRLACRTALESSGLRSDKVRVVELCTFCHRELFYSYRRDGPETGSHMMWVWLK